MGKTKKTGLLLFCLAMLLSGPGTSQALRAQEVRLDVPFVPTPYEVIEDMLRFADLKKGDILYDLGCGDGRIVIEAARRAGIRAVGIDIDPERIRESRENARLAGVDNLVEFRRADIFESDFSEATVVTMYLLPGINLRLRPTILKLRPGTRIISHQFDMDDWQADRMTYVPVDLYVHTVFLWIVPANISGTWDWTLDLKQKKAVCRLEVKQTYQFYKGLLYIDDQVVHLPEAKVEGDRVEFSAFLPGSDDIELIFSGKTDGDRLAGTVTVRQGQKNTRQAWKAARREGTSERIDY
ncbi:MAG: methyltransferase domain-containing protein [Candidatus Saccharicenans sp.]|nr:methyltransferase domain-containing protein [Candidatus Saccharicenans sp.]MDI6850260.1 methyltransferase domain-containing protein [Candidatus Saccharicenans sp.]